MHLIDLENTQEWQSIGYELPNYNQNIIRKSSLAEPSWLHFGAGNIFRAFPAVACEKLLNRGVWNKGITVCEVYDEEIIDKIYLPYNSLSLVVSLKHDGTVKKRVVGSVIEALKASKDMLRLKEIFMSKSLQMVSFTITEKGYVVLQKDGSFFEDVEQDINNFAENPKNIMVLLTKLCYERYKKGGFPLALVSMDNCSHNGEKLQQAILTVALACEKQGHIENEFILWLNSQEKLSFPWTVIDKITPRPSEQVASLLAEDNFEDIEIFITKKNTYIAPFVNGEETEYLVIEDKFPNGRPPLEQVGMIFTDRETTNNFETMKVCTCLNPLHTALAIFGCLLDYKLISEEMKNPLLVKLLERLGYLEGLPVVVDPRVIEPRDFLKECLTVRFPNPFVPDTPQRIACDTSQKLAIRFGETIKATILAGESVEKFSAIPLVFAGWLRYLVGKDDSLKIIALSSDPRLTELQQKVQHAIERDQELQPLKAILSDKSIFGVDLYECGLGNKVEKLFYEMLSGSGAVVKTLERELRK